MASVALVLLIILTGCLSLPLQPALDFSGPGWIVEQGQAVWRPKADAAEIAGELLVARHPDGSSIVQFIKTPLPMVTAQRSPEAWQVQFLAQEKHYAGRGRPPGRLLWLHLSDALAGRPLASNWALTRGPEGNWRFENLKTKETLNGFLVPHPK